MGIPDGGVDMFLKVKGARHGLIKGESQDEIHKTEIVVSTWSWGMDAKPSLGGGSAVTGRASIRELRVAKRIDLASTPLMSALRTNEVVSEAVLTVRSSKSKHEYLKITIKEGRVTGLTIEGDGDASVGGGLVEHVSFSFNSISVVYSGQDKDGKSLGDCEYSDEFDNR